MASHEEDVARVIKIEFQQNSKIELSIVLRCELSTMYLAASSDRKEEIIHFWNLVHKHLRNVFIKIFDEMFEIKFESYVNLFFEFANVAFSELFNLNQNLKLNQLFVIENKIHFINYNIYLINLKQNLNVMIKN